MNPQTYSAPWPFTCPFCGIEAPVYLRGIAPHLIPEKHCTHAVNAVREGTRVVVHFTEE